MPYQKKNMFDCGKKNERQCNLLLKPYFGCWAPIWKVVGINFNIFMKFNTSYCWIIIIFRVLIKFAKARKMNEFEYEFEFQIKIKIKTKVKKFWLFEVFFLIWTTPIRNVYVASFLHSSQIVVFIIQRIRLSLSPYL